MCLVVILANPLGLSWSVLKSDDEICTSGRHRSGNSGSRSWIRRKFAQKGGRTGALLRPKVQALKNLPVKMVKCGANQAHRPYNECGCRSVIVGDLNPEDCSADNFQPCGDGGNDRLGLYGRHKQL